MDRGAGSRAAERVEVAVHGRRRGEPDRLADLAHRRRVAAVAGLGLDELEDVALAGGESLVGHGTRSYARSTPESNICSLWVGRSRIGQPLDERTTVRVQLFVRTVVRSTLRRRSATIRPPSWESDDMTAALRAPIIAVVRARSPSARPSAATYRRRRACRRHRARRAASRSARWRPTMCWPAPAASLPPPP